MHATNHLIELRQLLAERFPKVRMAASAPLASSETVATGVPPLEELLGGGCPRGELTELIGVGTGSGTAQVVHALLRRVAADGEFLALVDGADSFDVSAAEPEVLTHLLWVRCTNTEESLKATDFLLRDRNVPLVVLDLKLNPATQLNKISSSVWFRFHRLLEQNGTTLLVVTPFQLVSGVACRVRVETGLGLAALSGAPDELWPQLKFTLLRAAAGSEDVAAQAG